MSMLITQVMDEFSVILNSSPIEDAPERLVRQAGLAGNVVAIEALVRLLVIESARRRHTEAKYAEAQRRVGGER